MTITAELNEANKELTIRIQGRFDFGALQYFRSTYENVKMPVNKYIVDLANADYLDSSALGMLLALRDHAGGDDANVRIAHCQPDVKKILLVTKLDELFDID